MLIVIVIIGILAAALIPRLSGAQSRANDTARKSDLYQLGVALAAYQMDKGKVPTFTTWTSLAGISGLLMGVGINAIPTDPDDSRQFSGIGNALITGWQYGYISIKKWWIDDKWFVVMAGTETVWWSNRVTDGTTTGMITGGTVFESIYFCTKITWAEGWPVSNNNWECTYDSTKDQLRYIYKY